MKVADPLVSFIDTPENHKYDAIIFATPHKFFIDLGVEKLRTFGKKNHVFFDVKSIYEPFSSDLRL